MWYRRFLFITFIGSLVTFITGMTIMPQTGGDIPIGESPETFYDNQRKEILNSRGFKMAIAGSAITILILILLLRNHVHQEEIAYVREARAQVIPYPQANLQVQAQAKLQLQVKPQAKLPQKIEELKEIIVVTPDPKHITHELSVRQIEPVKPIVRFGPIGTIGPRAPRAPIPPFRTFKYPPPYDILNKK